MDGSWGRYLGAPDANGDILHASNTGGGRRRPPDLVTLLAADNLSVNLGQFTIVPLLGILITNQDAHAGAGAVGFGLFAYFATVGVSCLLASRWIPRVQYTSAMIGSALIAGVGFGMLGFIHTFAALLVVLLIGGFGQSVHQVLARVLIAETVAGDIERTRAFSTMNIAVNVSGALGPFVGSALYASLGSGLLTTTVTVFYFLGAALLHIGLPRVLQPSNRRPVPTANAWPVSRAGIAQVLRRPEAWRAVVVATVATFLYAQFYSAFALLVAHRIAGPPLQAALLSGPAIIIVFLQRATTTIVTALLRRGARATTLLGSATVAFGASFIALGSGLPIITACISTVGIFAVAEMIFTPMLNATFAGLPFDSRLEALNFRQVCWTAGEALGSLCGGTLFLLLSDIGMDHLYWLMLGVAAVLGSLFVLVPRRRGTRVLLGLD